MSASALQALRLRFDAWCDRLDALPARERALLVLVVLALPLAVELFWAWPLHQQRSQVAASVLQSAQESADARAAADQAVDQERAELEATLHRLDADLARHGSGSQTTEPLAAMFERLLLRRPVRIESLRELALEDIAAPAPVALDAAVAGGVAASAPTAAALVRHRFDLVLAGEPAALVAALRALDRGARPLRIERVRMSADADAAVRVAITFTAVSTERSWLRL